MWTWEEMGDEHDQIIYKTLKELIKTLQFSIPLMIQEVQMLRETMVNRLQALDDPLSDTSESDNFKCI